MHLTREYLLEPVRLNSGAWERKHVFRCSRCPATGDIANSKHRGALAPGFIIRKMTERGWHIGRRIEDDLCPSCVKASMKNKATEVTNMRVVKSSEKVVPVPVVEAPRLPTFDEKRLILSKLDEVYLDANRGYSGGWSDKKVGSDLGIPWKWVADIREANFGPHGGNEVVGEVVAEAKALLADIEANRKEVEERVKSLAAREDALNKKLADVLKAVA